MTGLANGRANIVAWVRVLHRLIRVLLSIEPMVTLDDLESREQGYGFAIRERRVCTGRVRTITSITTITAIKSATARARDPIDPVCGMTVDRATAEAKALHTSYKGVDYFDGQAAAIAVTAGGATIGIVTRSTDFFHSDDGGRTWPPA